MSNGTNWRFNHQIRSPKVRVIDANGDQIGVMKKSEALSKAKEAGLDLVEIAPNAKPPVAKIVDIGKFKYEQEKKKKKSKKKAKTAEVKEVRLSPFIGDHDFKTRLEKIQEFLGEGHKIKIVIKFKGRQMGSKQFGYKIIEKVLDNLEKNFVVDMEPKFVGRHLTMVISPTNKADIDNMKVREKIKRRAKV